MDDLLASECVIFYVATAMTEKPRKIPMENKFQQ